MTHKHFQFEKIEILEWYDGLVRGIGIAQGRSYLVILVAWKIDTGEKLYVVLNLNEASKNQISSIFDEKKGTDEIMWKRFNSRFDRYLANYKGELAMITGTLKVEVGYKAKILDSAVVAKISPYSLETCLQPEQISFWFNT